MQTVIKNVYSEKVKASRARLKVAYRASTRGKAERSIQSKKYYATIHGRLHRIWNNMNQRCAHAAGYELIENKFVSAEDLITYVTNELNIDPRTLDCHRIDNVGNYEPGNIEFLTQEEHTLAHRALKGVD